MQERDERVRLIDLWDPEHAILNGVPNPYGGNEILATPVAGGSQLTDYDAGGGPISEYTAVIPGG